ncbi:recombinase family protein [Pararhizobium sp. BT-229]|uniref:recombinase family protein n=1 Tax=Pararhizobium sp. BT-229 TaxID=2986923 RepID=UPI0021F6CC33|nr:recombinase family protein [Pararhizobium sp. BT-229]MCV9964324.1 recombinase family protein [Pararhizobium sp. BT-229]
MGSKSQVRSMQRGAQKRDRGPEEKGSDYTGKPPSLRAEDRAHLGLTDEAFDKLAASLKQKVFGYASGGFRKPADVSRLLNKENIRTLSGSDWSPRLVYFLLSRIFGDRARGEKKQPAKTVQPLPDQNRFEAVRKAIRKRDHLKALPPVGSVSHPETAKFVTGKTTPSMATPKKERPPKQIKVRPPSDPVPLSSDEMARRLAALQAHFRRAPQ